MRSRTLHPLTLAVCRRHRTDGASCARRRCHARAAAQCRQGAAELADESPHLRRPALLAARSHQQGQRQGPEARLCGAARRRRRQRVERGDGRSPRTASSTSRIPGACSTRSTARSGDVGRIVWRMDPKQERQVNNRGAAFWGNLVITPANGPARIIATDKDTGKVVWETHVAYRPAAPADHRRGARRSRTRSSSAPPAATAACATGSPRSMPRPASCSGSSTPSRRRASPAARPGRTRTTPGAPAAAPCG